MACFEICILPVKPHEGPFNDTPGDRGGPTSWGITLDTAKLDAVLGDVDRDGDVDVDDIRAMPWETAKAFYYKYWWMPLQLAEFKSDVIASKVLDLAINWDRPIYRHRTQVGRVLQRAIRACGHEDVVEDGIIGPMTIEIVNLCREEILLPAIRMGADGFYRMIVAHDPSQAKFLAGWLKYRAHS